MTEQTMAAGFASSFADYACKKCAKRDALLAAGGLTEADLSDQDNRIPEAAYRTMIGAAIQQTGDTSLLLRHTLESRLETISDVGQIVHNSSSFLHSIEQLNRYLHLMASGKLTSGTDRFEVLHEGGGLWIIDHLPISPDAYLATEASFARFISEFRRSFSDATFEIGLEVTYPPPPHIDQYPELFRIPVQFSAPRNALQIDPVLGQPRDPV